MKYYKEKLFLKLIPECLIRELISYNIWDNTEKRIIEQLYIKNKTIQNLTMELNYEKTQLYEIYNNGILKFKKWLKTTENTHYKRLFKVVI